MKAFFTGSDYLLYIQKETKEIEKLGTSKLEAMLEFYEEDITDKKVTLELKDKVSHPDGIELSYTPKNPDNWEHIKEVNVAINDWALTHILNRGRFGTRYDGSGNKIDIYWMYYEMQSA